MTPKTGSTKLRGMPKRGAVDPGEMREAVTAVREWLDDAQHRPARPEMAKAVRLSLRTLEQIAPGNSVEVRVPPFAAVQCVEGPRHTRGTPPNVVETYARTWLLLATGRLTWSDAVDDGLLTASGSRSDVSQWLPIVRVEGS